MLPLLKKFCRDVSGATMVITAAAFSVLLGFTALSVDVGVLFLEHTRLSRAADAAVLAGAQELPDISRAESAARDYGQRNGIDNNQFTINFSNNNKQISGIASKYVDLYFARVFGKDSSLVRGRAVARVAPVKAVTGLIPIGINDILLPLTIGQEYLLKAGAHDQVLGWRGILEYPGQSGSTDYRDSAYYGYNSKVEINDIEWKAAGNKSGPTVQGIQERMALCTNGCTWDNYELGCPRVVIVPIYRDLDPAYKVKIVGFAAVFLERVVGQGEASKVYARYIHFTYSGEIDDSITDSYLNSVQLVE
ncbi:MAG: pilus assembly protein TadG-related protein [Thermincola sp.]|jgi:hypothetical protein|nr:pilus assembly protein TadG-related protein [Thermincola sp.]MDT3703400.1 pilus assembly protein TadG-related protein [Thermincola sp.]